MKTKVFITFIETMTSYLLNRNLMSKTNLVMSKTQIKIHSNHLPYMGYKNTNCFIIDTFRPSLTYQNRP